MLRTTIALAALSLFMFACAAPLPTESSHQKNERPVIFTADEIAGRYAIDAPGFSVSYLLKKDGWGLASINVEPNNRRPVSADGGAASNANAASAVAEGDDEIVTLRPIYACTWRLARNDLVIVNLGADADPDGRNGELHYFRPTRLPDGGLALIEFQGPDGPELDLVFRREPDPLETRAEAPTAQRHQAPPE